jgi:hypothetical protein
MSFNNYIAIDDRMISEYEEVVGMRVGRESGCTQRKPTPVPLYPPQIPHDLTWDQTRQPQWETGSSIPVITHARASPFLA